MSEGDGFLLLMGGFLYAVGAFAVGFYWAEQKASAAAVAVAGLLWPVALVLAIAQRTWGEEARLRREAIRLDRERRLLELRRQVEAKREAYRKEFDRYVEDA